jgi:hypothetical protein
MGVLHSAEQAASDDEKDDILQLKIKIMQQNTSSATVIEYLLALLERHPETLHLHISLLETYKRNSKYLRYEFTSS